MVQESQGGGEQPGHQQPDRAGQRGGVCAQDGVQQDGGEFCGGGFMKYLTDSCVEVVARLVQRTAAGETIRTFNDSPHLQNINATEFIAVDLISKRNRGQFFGEAMVEESNAKWTAIT